MSDVAHIHAHHQQESGKRAVLGFWMYLMTDCLLFASLFATYAVLRNNTYGGPDASELFSLPFVLVETMILLTSSFVAGLALLAARRSQLRQVLVLLAITFLLGAGFLAMELYEFHKLIAEGAGPQTSAFLSAYFTLVGTHGLHIVFGLLWVLVLMGQLVRKGLTTNTLRRLTLFGLFWHFLDVIWIFIFSIVYLMGAL